MGTPDARVTDQERSRTVEDAVREVLNGPKSQAPGDHYDIVNGYVIEDICAALGLDPATPLANVVALQPGQHVVEYREGRLPPGTRMLDDDYEDPYEATYEVTDRWVVVRSAT